MFDCIAYLDGIRPDLVNIMDQIWEFAEVKNKEFKSSALLKGVLRENGFVVTENVAGLETAFIGTYGSGRPGIAFLGEFDALPGLSQEAGALERRPVVPGGAGHACAHHALGTGALGGALAAKEYLRNNNLPGTVRYYGCPAEEGGLGKQVMARCGVFSDVDAALTWHSTDDNNMWSMNFLAAMGAEFHFKGVPAAAPGQANIGRSALEAVELMNVGANYLRGHLLPDTFINYAIVDAGGAAPNAIPAHASVSYILRSDRRKKITQVYNRLVEVAKGAALMTGTTVEYSSEFGTTELIPNRALEQIVFENLKKIGPVPYNEEDLYYARELRKTLPEGAEGQTFEALHMLYGKDADELIRQIRGKPINDIVYPFKAIDRAKFGSTDVCDVSWFTPVAQVTTACYAKDTPGHCWQVTAQGKTNLCRNGMLNAAKILALSAIELFTQPLKLRDVREEFGARIKGKNYEDNFQ